MFIRSHSKKTHISKQTTNGKRFMEEHPAALRLLRDYRAGKYGFNIGGKR